MTPILIRPDFDFFCHDKKAYSGGEIESGKVTKEGRIVADKIDFYIKHTSKNGIEVIKAPDRGEFELPFILLGFQGTDLSYDEGCEQGIKFLQDSCDEMESLLINAGCSETIKIVKFPIGVEEKNGEATVGELCAFVGCK